MKWEHRPGSSWVCQREALLGIGPRDVSHSMFYGGSYGHVALHSTPRELHTTDCVWSFFLYLWRGDWIALFISILCEQSPLFKAFFKRKTSCMVCVLVTVYMHIMPSWCCNMESNWLSDSHSVKLDFEQPTCNNYASCFSETGNQHGDGEMYSLRITLGNPAVEPRQSQKWMSHSFQWRIHVKTDIKKSILSLKTHRKKIPAAYAIRWAGKNFVTVGLVILCRDTFFREYNGNQWPCRTPFCKFHVYWISMEFLFITQQRCWRPVRATLKA